jgi:hypothetical protein
MTYFDGRKHAGEFRDDKPHGQGTLALPNGTEFVGEFRDGKRSGTGTEYRADGSVLKSGIWQD